MARLFRSKSCSLVGTRRNNMFASKSRNYDSTDEEDEDEDEWGFTDMNSIGTPLVRSDQDSQQGRNYNYAAHQHHYHGPHQFSVLAILLTALRKSIITCSVETDDVPSMDISGPTEVRHVSHVTFDQFNGFLGLPVELEPELPRKVPSASASVFGVSANSMQCSYDERGNSIPTILLMMQKHLYKEGGLQAEGIFRINAGNSQEAHVRNQLNEGLLPDGVDIHCLAGLIKAWFRELPLGILDSITPEQVMRCNTEDECTQLVKLLPQTEAALLDWSINLMADVVEHQHHNKMNACNIAMVFAPNMTQMADPLTALIHAVQVMNFLQTLVIKTLRERAESSHSFSTHKSDEPHSSCSDNVSSCGPHRPHNEPEPASKYLLRTATLNRLQSDCEEQLWDFPKNMDGQDELESGSGCSTPPPYDGNRDFEKGCKIGYENNTENGGISERLNSRKGVIRKLCNHPVFNLSKSTKKSTHIVHDIAK